MHSVYSRFSEDEAYGSLNPTPVQNMSPENSDYEKSSGGLPSFSCPTSSTSPHDHFLLFDELSDLMLDQQHPRSPQTVTDLEEILISTTTTVHASSSDVTGHSDDVTDDITLHSLEDNEQDVDIDLELGESTYSRAMEDHMGFGPKSSDSTTNWGQIDPINSVSGSESSPPGGICLVCGDTSSGFHYGVASCEACKAFFKRTIQGNIEYRCLLNRACEVSKRRRKACQACRLKKCFRVGMLREGVRLDRVRGGRQKYARGFPNAYNSPFAYKKNFQEEENLISYLKSIQPQQSVYEKETTGKEMETPELPMSMDHLNVISALADSELVAMVTWAKQLPDFSKLSLNDQILLFHYSWNEILLLSFIHRSLPYNGRLHFSPTFSISKSEWVNSQIEDLMSVISDVIKIFQINLCRLSNEEYILLKALVICNTEGLSKIQGISNISKLRKNLLDCLNHITITQKCSDPYRVSKILLCLPYLRQLDIESRNFWNKVKKEGKVTLRKLFVEMLEAF